MCTLLLACHWPDYSRLKGMAYAGIAGVPLRWVCTCPFRGLFVYAILGTSRHLAVSATSSSAAMLAALVALIALEEAKICRAGFGYCRRGRCDFPCWRPARTKFSIGVRFQVCSQRVYFRLSAHHHGETRTQVPGNFHGHDNLFQQTWHVITPSREVNLWAVGVGATALERSCSCCGWLLCSCQWHWLCWCLEAWPSHYLACSIMVWR